VTPQVVVLAAPSGGGKTTIANAVLTGQPAVFGYSVSATTRKPRAGEQDGVAYHFLTREEFERRVGAGEFLEWAEYAGERYGTLRREVERVLAAGRHVVLDIEVQGAKQVRQSYPRPRSVSIFVIPPSPRVLIERLRERRTESEREVRERLAIAVREVEAVRNDMRQAAVFDHVLVNDHLDTAVRRVIDLVEHPVRAAPHQGEVDRLLGDFLEQLKRESDRLPESTKRSR
jgi:guanylate kinase